MSIFPFLNAFDPIVVSLALSGTIRLFNPLKSTLKQKDNIASLQMDNDTNTTYIDDYNENEGMAQGILILVVVFSVIAFLICCCVIVTIIVCCCTAVVGIKQAFKPPAPPAEIPINGFEQGSVVEMAPHDPNTHKNEYDDQ